MFALGASHVVTSVNFFRAEPTLGAFDHSIEYHVVSQLRIAHVVAGDPFMTHSSTLETHVLATGALLIV